MPRNADKVSWRLPPNCALQRAGAAVGFSIEGLAAQGVVRCPLMVEIPGLHSLGFADMDIQLCEADIHFHLSSDRQPAGGTAAATPSWKASYAISE
jgi:hypothetical protein